MIRAAILGLGSWGQHLVRCCGGDAAGIRFTAAATRTPDKARDFAASHGLRWLDSYETALADPEIDAMVLAAPHHQHADQVIAGARSSETGVPLWRGEPRVAGFAG